MKVYKEYFKNKSFLISFFSGFFLFLVSLVMQFMASNYATRSVSGSVTDIVLSNTRVYDVDLFFIYGTLALCLFVICLCFSHPKYLPFVLKSIAIFTLIRAVFISLTHINVYPLHVALDSVFFQDALFKGILTGSGLFFSGHTGLPFLLALMFWENKKLRFFFIGCSIFFGLVMLLGHLHYSIDVLSAFFITYAIFDLCKFLFQKDWQLFLSK